MNPHDDDLDALFRAAPPPRPPLDLAARARARLRAMRRARRLTALVAVEMLAIGVLALLAFLLGLRLARTEAPVLLTLLAEDRAVARYAGRELLGALFQAIPWPYLAGSALLALLLVALTGYLLRAAGRVAADAARGGRR